MAAKVLLGVTGCIGAYKAAEILRGLQKAGVEVRVMMTKNAMSRKLSRLSARIKAI